MEGQIECVRVSRNKTETKIKESCWLGHSGDKTVRSRENGGDILSARSAGKHDFTNSSYRTETNSNLHGVLIFRFVQKYFFYTTTRIVRQRKKRDKDRNKKREKKDKNI